MSYPGVPKLQLQIKQETVSSIAKTGSCRSSFLQKAAAQRKILTTLNIQNIDKQNAFSELTMRCYTTDLRPLVE